MPGALLQTRVPADGTGRWRMLGSLDATVFLATTAPLAAQRFYGETLGLRLLEETPYALVFAAGRTVVRVQIVQAFTPHPFTSVGWQVADIADCVDQLAAKGVAFERYEMLPQDGRGIWEAPGGARVAWFKDPDGNLISLAQGG